MSRKNTKIIGNRYEEMGIYGLYIKACSIVKRYARRRKEAKFIDFYNDHLVKKKEKLLVRRFRYCYFSKPNFIKEGFCVSLVPLQLVKEKLSDGLPYKIALKAAQRKANRIKRRNNNEE